MTVDTTNPVINNTRPVNGGYFNNPSSLLFQVSLTEQNLNTAVNVTVYYRKYETGAYQSGSLACYGNVPSYTCNTTKELGALIGDAQVLQFFFNTTDLAGRTASNGNQTTPLTATADTSSPTYTNNNVNVTTIKVGDTVLIYAQWNGSISGLAYAWLWTNETGTTGNNYTANYGSPAYMVGNTTTWSNFTWQNTSVTVGTVVGWKIYANDSVGNENVTSTGTFTIDNTKPQYYSNGTNVTQGTIAKNTPIYIYFNWTDNVGLGYAWLSTNETGAWVNYSSTGRIVDINLTSTQTWSNFTWQNTSVSLGQEIAIKIYANDTSGNENVSDSMIWTIDSTKPQYDNISTNPSSPVEYGPGKTYIFNVSWSDNIGVSNVTFEWNGADNTSTVTSLGSNNYSVTKTGLGFTASNYTYKWYANDTSNNWNVTTVQTYNITRNTTNPIDIYIQNSTAYKNTNVTGSAGQSITVNATAVYGNETELKLYSNVSGNEAQVSNPYTFTPLSANVTTFKANITATNYTSNQTATYYLTITADNVPPTILLYDYTNATAKKSGAALTLNIYASDATGITPGDSCNVTIAGVTNYTAINYSNGWCNGTITVPHVDSDGNYTINITVKDNSTTKNVGINASYVLTVDNTTPVVTLTATPTSGSYNKLSGNRYWINGTVYDLIAMGSGNVTTNNSAFIAYSFNGTNDTAFSIANNTAVSDGYVAITVYYNDSATNTGSASIAFYIDNTPPTVIALKNSSTGTYQPSSAQVIEILVTDAKTNDTITFYYRANNWYNQTWLTKTMTGTPGTSTTYSTTIDTSELSNDMYLMYYITGSDNATNSITNGGSASSPLTNITIDQYCGNNGTLLSYCEHLKSAIWPPLWLSPGFIMNTWSSLGGNMTVPKVLESISGKYSYVYYYNGTSWASYNPSYTWSQSDLKYMNNTNNLPYSINMTSTGTIRIS
jgi:hypothetical protein